MRKKSFKTHVWRMIAIVLSSVMLLSTVSVSAFAEETDTDKLSIFADQAIVYGGEIVEIPIRLANNTNLCGLRIRIEYDENLLLTEVRQGEALSEMTFTEPGDYFDDPVYLLWDAAEECHENGIIAVLTFVVPEEEGICNISISCEPEDVVDGNGTMIPFETKDCCVIVNSPHQVKASDTFENFGYTLYSDGLFIISGSGSIPSYSNPNDVPWNAFRDNIKRIEIDQRITEIGQYAFYGCSALETMVIPEGVTSIAAYAFYRCCNLASVMIPTTIQYIGSHAFYECNNLKEICYSGNADQWSSVKKDNAFPEDISFYIILPDDESLDVTIETEEVLGGVMVSMKSERGTIYYTTDGTTEPGAGTFIYEGKFLVGKKGNYSIRAVAIDLETRTKGGVTAAPAFEIKKSDSPVITSEEDRYISITPQENVYYTLDLEEEPTENSREYEGKIPYTTSTTINARVIEIGKESSDVVSSFFEVETQGIAIPEGTFSFQNHASVFGYPALKGPDYGPVFKAFFGKEKGKHFEETYNKNNELNGFCYGMSVTVQLFAMGALKLGKFRDASSMSSSIYFSLISPAVNSKLRSVIERYHVSQFIEEVIEEREGKHEGDETTSGNMVISGEIDNAKKGNELINAISNSCVGKDRIVLILYSPDNKDQHAVVPYKITENRIYIYDCNKPFKIDPNEKWITIEKKYLQNGETSEENYYYSFLYNDGVVKYTNISFNRISTILSKIDNIESPVAILQSEENERYLVSLNSEMFQISDKQGLSVEPNTTMINALDMVLEDTSLYLDDGTYLIKNQDSSLQNFKLSVSTENEYYTVIVSDPSARAEIGKENGRLYLIIQCDAPAEMRAKTSNSAGKQNTIEATADYLKIYSCTDLAILVQSSAETVTLNEEEQVLFSDSNGMYAGAAAQRSVNETMPEYEINQGYKLTADLSELPEDDCILYISVNNASDGLSLITAGYDENNRMIFVKTIETEQGTTSYPFLVPGGTNHVRVFLAETDGLLPVSEYLEIYSS